MLPNQKTFEYQQLIDALRKEMENQLSTKTGWGRNEIMQALDRAVSISILNLWQGDK